MKKIEELCHEAERLHFAVFHQVLSRFGLGKGQPPILMYLSEKDGAAQSEIAKIERITPATATVTLQTMEKNGLVRRESDERDLRVMRVYLTDKGKDVLKESRQAIDKIEDEIYTDFTPEEMEEFCRLTEKKKAKLEKMLGKE